MKDYESLKETKKQLDIQLEERLLKMEEVNN